MAYGYHSLSACVYRSSLRDFGWTLGVHKSPAGYQHPWIVVLGSETVGAWTRAEARDIWRKRK